MIAENLYRLEEKISKKCEDVGRNRSEITLIGVTKTQPIEIIQRAVDLGLKDLGENKAQELRDKAELIIGNFRWHYIGHLQTNKVKYIINSAEFIHSVDSMKLAEEIDKRAKVIEKVQKVLLEIKTSDEATKYGLVEEKEIVTVAEYCTLKENLKLVGLMTIAPFTDDNFAIRNCFIRLRNIKEELNDMGFEIKELSMGMTNDYEIAIEEGATMLRIGTAIFGVRN